jgi:hypothetical protein
MPGSSHRILRCALITLLHRSPVGGHKDDLVSQAIRSRPGALGSLTGGGVSERPKERASKAREVQASAGSNPAATASLTRPKAGRAARWAPVFLAVVSNVVSIGPHWCLSAGPQEAVEAAGRVTVDRRDYVSVAARHRGG